MIETTPVRTFSASKRFKRTWSIEQRDQVLQILKLNEGDYEATSDQTGISVKYIKAWESKEEEYSQIKNKSSKCRLSGGGRPLTSNDLDERVKKWVIDERSKPSKPIISRTHLKEHAMQVAKDLDLTKFKCSQNWIDSFMKRNGLSYRMPTHVAQQNNKTPATKCLEVITHLNKFNCMASEYSLDLILNMDETPMYFDLLEGKTIDFKGAKSVDVCHTGNDKSRFTAVITISASGIMLPVYIIFKNLKKIPLIFKTQPAPNNIVLQVSKSGTMDQYLMQDYIKRVIVPYTQGRKSLMLLDECACHYTALANDAFNLASVSPCLIPGGYTSSLQPLDIAINKPIKSNYKAFWNEFIRDENGGLTAGGNRKKPSYFDVVNWVSTSVNQINSSTIRRSFETCGLFMLNTFNCIQYSSQLNSRLKQQLFITNAHFERDVKLAYMVTYNFSANFNTSGLCDKIVEYITEFKDFVQPEPEPAQDVRQIVIDNELDVNLNDSIENELNAFFTDFKNLQ